MTTIDGTDAVIVTCCHCGARFDERLIGGSFLDRRCPSCKRRISEDDYDALAAKLLSSASLVARRQWESGQLDRFFRSQSYDGRYGWVERAGT